MLDQGNVSDMLRMLLTHPKSNYKILCERFPTNLAGDGLAKCCKANVL